MAKVYAGATDEITTCECCGRAGLKKTIRIILTDAQGENDGEMYYGSQCAAKAFGGTSKGILKAAETNAMIASDWMREATRIIGTITAKAVEVYGTDRKGRLYRVAADTIKENYNLTDDVAWVRGVAYVNRYLKVLETNGTSELSFHAR